MEGKQKSWKTGVAILVRENDGIDTSVAVEIK